MFMQMRKVAFSCCLLITNAALAGKKINMFNQGQSGCQTYPNETAKNIFSKVSYFSLLSIDYICYCQTVYHK